MRKITFALILISFLLLVKFVMIFVCLLSADYTRKLDSMRGELLERLIINELFLSYMMYNYVLDFGQKYDIQEVLPFYFYKFYKCIFCKKKEY